MQPVTPEVRAAAENVARIRSGAEKLQDVYGPIDRRTLDTIAESARIVQQKSRDDELMLIDFALSALDAAARGDDGDEPITEEWLHQCYPGRVCEGLSVICWLNLTQCGTLQYQLTARESRVVVNDGDSQNVIINNPTRRQLRDLLATLGKDV